MSSYYYYDGTGGLVGGDGGGSVAAPGAGVDNLVQEEDGTSAFTLEDDSGVLLLEESA